jgi:hypothetical protein
MINETYTVDILVNDKPIRKYPHDNKLFVEARKGDTYSIRIKNNSHNRILTVTSVDGLDTLTGKSATENGNGYVINGYNSLTIDGFRVSDDKVAKFLFDYKGGSYAASKEDGSERNVGVIGVRIFTEKVKRLPSPIIVKEEIHHYHHPYDPWGDYPTIWGSGDTIRYGSTLCDSGPTMDCCDMDDGTTVNNSQYTHDFSAPGATAKERPRSISHKLNSPIRSMNCLADTVKPEVLGFDMGTKFGESKESHVIEVEFETGILALTANIYYASRQSLISMGVPLGNEKQVSFPEPFEGSKYANPPKNWQD